MISIRRTAIMKSHIILSVFLFNVLFAMKKPPDHQFLSRNHDGKKTIVTDGVKTKVSVSKVFWSMIEGDYIYGKKRVIGKRENGFYR